MAKSKAFLLGWTGAQRKHVEKYAAVYDALGLETESVVDHCPMFVAELPRLSTLDVVATRVADAAAACVASGGKVVFAFFSNGGAFLWLRVATKLAAAKVPVSALIVDSAPGHLLSLRFAFNFCWEMSPAPVARAGLVLLSPALAALGAFSYAAALQFLPSHNIQSQYMDALAAFPRHSPGLRVLFIYSADDLLVPPDTVQACSRNFADAGAAVDTWRLDASPHVQHLRTAPADYAERVAGHLGRAGVI